MDLNFTVKRITDFLSHRLLLVAYVKNAAGGFKAESPVGSPIFCANIYINPVRRLLVSELTAQMLAGRG